LTWLPGLVARREQAKGSVDHCQNLSAASGCCAAICGFTETDPPGWPSRGGFVYIRVLFASGKGKRFHGMNLWGVVRVSKVGQQRFGLLL